MFDIQHQFSFMKYRKFYYIISVAIIVLGIGIGMIRGYNYGIDFTGGTMMQLDMGKPVTEATIEDLQTVLHSDKLDADIVVAGKDNDQVIIKMVQALDTDARDKTLNHIFEKFNLNNDSVMTIEQFGPSVGEMLEKNAVKAVLIASIGMLIYISIRFEWKFGLASIIAVLHDVFVLLAFYGIFHMPINNPFIAAVLTIVGYSIMDTIVIFDRVRENLDIMKRTKLEELIDHSINQTLGRSLMTSVATVVAIVPLCILGGETIRDFTLPLIIGIAAGTCSSIFIASPLYYQLCVATGGSKYKARKKK
ncbi:MAG TPA: protein translocase subunit SecF [Bacillota bacterium]|nr:protein translocase subunit SecF [Bacillota bacterium]